MTLLSALRATKVLGLAVVLVAGGMTAADARDGWHSRHHDHHQRIKRLPGFEPRAHGGRLGIEFHQGDSGPRFRQEGRGFYRGAFTAYRSYGRDIYFYVENDGRADWRRSLRNPRRSGSKVITVTPHSNGCSWEAGVCVIRPGW